MKTHALLISLALGATCLTAPAPAYPDDAALSAIEAQVARQRDAGIKRLQEWIARPAIAAEDRGFPEGAEYMAEKLRDSGFQQVRIIPTDGKPGVFATLDAGAENTVGIYFMYDVKQFDPAEWSSPPLEGAIVDKPGLGKAVMGRGAVNQKGPESAFLEAVRAIRDANQQMPVNLVLVAEGEEEIGSPNVGQIVYEPEVQKALSGTLGVMLPFAQQSPDGSLNINLGAKGVIEVQLIASGERWGRGPSKDVHSSLKAMVDSPAWRLVKALNTLVSEDGNTITIDNYPKARPLTTEEKTMIARAAETMDEAEMKQRLSTQHWIDDLPFVEALERLVSQPTINIEGLVAGYTGPGGKTVLPNRAEAKLDLRLPPELTAASALAALEAHLEKHGYGDIEVVFSGGYDPTTTSAESKLVKAQVAVLKAEGLNPVLWPRLAGSYPGYAFTNPPLSLPAVHFGLGHGGGAHAPDEYFIVESINPNIESWEGAVMSYVKYLYELSK